MVKKQFSPQAIKALKDTLSTIFWFKDSLTDYLRYIIADGYKLLSSTDTINSTKRDIVSSFVDKLILNQNIYHDDIIHIIDNLCNWSNFTELESNDKIQQIKVAKASIQNLKTISQSFLDAKISEMKRKEMQERSAKEFESKKYFLDELEKLKNEYLNISQLEIQKKGGAFERILYRLTELFDLDPKASYKIVGEQIDGAFSFETQEYIMEAKYHSDVVDHTHIILFIEKVNTKLENTLGVLISYSGFTPTAIEKANNKNILLMDGSDLYLILDNRVDLRNLIRYKRKHASQTGNSFYRAQEIIGKLNE